MGHPSAIIQLAGKRTHPAPAMTREEKTEPSIDRRTKVDLENAVSRNAGAMKIPNAAVDSALTAELASTSAAEKKGKGIREHGLRV